MEILISGLGILLFLQVANGMYQSASASIPVVEEDFNISLSKNHKEQ